MYTILKGESPQVIAKKIHMSVKRLQHLNPEAFKNGAYRYTGTQLRTKPGEPLGRQVLPKNKMRIFYIDGVPLDQCLITQNEVGRYYWSSAKGYWKTALDRFDSALPPRSYTTYINGSHGNTNYEGINIKKQQALDVVLPDSKPMLNATITCSVDVFMKAQSPAGNSYCVLTSGLSILGIKEWEDWLDHTYKWAKVGTWIRAGQPICKISYNHLHIFCKHFGIYYPVRNCILNK